jgi:hypothetical protein
MFAFFQGRQAVTHDAARVAENEQYVAALETELNRDAEQWLASLGQPAPPSDEPIALAKVVATTADRPRSELATERRAEQLGISPDDVLLGDLIRMNLNMQQYPSADCLTPPEIDDAGTDVRLSPQRLEHLAACPFCQQLFESLHPQPAGHEHLMQEVRGLRSGAFSPVDVRSPAGEWEIAAQPAAQPATQPALFAHRLM